MMQGAFEPCLSSWERPMMTNADVCVYKYFFCLWSRLCEFG